MRTFNHLLARDFIDERTAGPGIGDRARAAYEAYGTFVGWKAVSGAAMPQWSELPERIRAAWMVGVGASIGERVPIDPSEYPASRALPSQEVR